MVSSNVFIYKDLSFKFVSQTLFVSECFDRVLTRRFQRRIERSDDAAEDREHRSSEDPVAGNFDHQSRKGRCKSPLYEEACARSENHAKNAHNRGFLKD